LKKLIFTFVFLLLDLPCAAEIIIVDANGTGDYLTIQAAIIAASDYDIIEVQPGTYKGDGNRDIDFLGKAITVQSIDPNDPNIVATTIIDCNGSEAESHRGFYFHSGENEDSIVNGLTVTNGFDTYRGGGIYCYQSSPIIENCTISNCGNDGHGGGINCNKGSPKIRDCIITGNFSYGSGGGLSFYRSSATVINCMVNGNSVVYSRGGGIICDESSPTFRDCVITGNVSMSGDGGGISCNNESSPIFSDCLISGNLADKLGGGIYCNDSSPVISECTIGGNLASGGGGAHCQVGSTAKFFNCLISGNTAIRSGGGIQCWDASPIITNCTIADNLSEDRPGGGLECSLGASPEITNCILWDNSPQEVELRQHAQPCKPLIIYSDIKGDWLGEGNIDADPFFVELGFWDANGVWVEGDYHLLPGSPCIDVGDNTAVPADTADLDGDGNTTEPIPFDLDGNPRIVDGNDDGNSVVDMGAYETALSDPVELLDN